MDERIEVWVPASELIRLHGVAGAALFARERIVDLRQLSQAGADRWHIILDVIWELGRTTPTAAEEIH